MIIRDDARIMQLYAAAIKKNYNALREQFRSKKAVALVDSVYTQATWTEITAEVFFLDIDGIRYVVKKIVLGEDDVFQDNACEVLANIVLTVDHPDIVVPLRNIAVAYERLYLFYDHAGLTMDKFIREIPTKEFTPAIAYQLLRGALTVLNQLHVSKYKVSHFDCRTDNLFVAIDSSWEDVDEFGPDDNAPDLVTHTNDDELSFHVRAADWGFSELTLSKKRIKNAQLPRNKNKKVTKKWGKYPLVMCESYDTLYLMITFADDLDRFKAGHWLGPVWAEISKRHPQFNPGTFFTAQGRMNTFLELSTVDVISIVDDLYAQYTSPAARTNHGDA